MKEARLSEQAEKDLTDIWLYIAQDSPRAADRFVLRVHAKCQELAESPGIGRPRAELARGLRSFPLGSYLIFYREAEDGIEVVRVLSGYRDLPPLFTE